MDGLSTGSLVISELNRLSVLRTIRRLPDFARMDVVREAGLSLPTVNEILRQFMADGQVVEAGIAPSSGGRPAARFRLNPRSRYAVGVQAMLPSIHIALVDLTDGVIGLTSAPFDERSDGDYVLRTIRECVSRLLDENGLQVSRIIGAGIGVPGFVHRETGAWLSFPATPLIRDVPLRAELERSYGAAFIQNEMNVYAAAGLRLLGQPRREDLIAITCADGIKSSVEVGGRILSGDHGNFGSVGHFVVVENGRPCHCGALGCLEAYVSGRALQQVVASDPELQSTFDGMTTPEVAAAVFARAAAGDARCRELVEEVAPLMAYAFASLVRLTDIDRILLLGAFSSGGAYLRELLHQQVAARLPAVERSSLEIRLGPAITTEHLVAAAAAPVLATYFGAADACAG